ncbi:MAG TPA: DUF1080 domain-containing protein [Planctomycetota bacterium]|jgi:hypothetical protein|nr:DUF1080 domain-containing protein [Planctomycetota bacterium]
MVRILAWAAALAAAGQAGEEGFTPLFNGKDLSGWTYFLEKKGPNQDGTMKMEDVWSVKDGVLHCKGRPNGYIRTEKDYKNFILKLEWRWPEGKGYNSGVLLRMVGPDKVWPRSIEAQLMSGHAGDFWLIDGARLETAPERVDAKTPRHRLKIKANEKPLGEWNEYEITVDKGKVVLKVNGEVLNEGTGAEEVAGKICLQSEGGPIEFRNIRIKPLE